MFWILDFDFFYKVTLTFGTTSESESSCSKKTATKIKKVITISVRDQPQLFYENELI